MAVGVPMVFVEYCSPAEHWAQFSVQITNLHRMQFTLAMVSRCHTTGTKSPTQLDRQTHPGAYDRHTTSGKVDAPTWSSQAHCRTKGARPPCSQGDGAWGTSPIGQNPVGCCQTSGGGGGIPVTRVQVRDGHRQRGGRGMHVSEEGGCPGTPKFVYRK